MLIYFADPHVHRLDKPGVFDGESVRAGFVVPVAGPSDAVRACTINLTGAGTHAAATAIPTCPLCSHPHGEADRCGNCGHTGREPIIPRHGPTNHHMHIDAVDESSATPDVLRAHLALCVILRKQVFVDELGLAEPMFELSAADRACRHVLLKSM